MMTIMVDTREQLPLWSPFTPNSVLIKLEVGDYTTKFLNGKSHAERKSPNDLYGSIIQGHRRFRNMLNLARDKDIRLKVFVECSEDRFYGKRFNRASILKAPEPTLRRIISTISDKYCVDFLFCDGREDMRCKILEWFLQEYESYESNEFKAYDRCLR